MDKVKIKLPANVDVWGHYANNNDDVVTEALWGLQANMLLNDYTTGIGLKLYAYKDEVQWQLILDCGAHCRPTFRVLKYSDVDHLYPTGWKEEFRKAGGARRAQMLLETFPKFVEFVQNRIDDLASRTDMYPVVFEDSYCVLACTSFQASIHITSVREGSLANAVYFRDVERGEWATPYVMKNEAGLYFYPSMPSWGGTYKTIGEAAKDWVIRTYSREIITFVPLSDAKKIGLFSGTFSSLNTFIKDAIAAALVEAPTPKKSKRKK